MPTIRDVAHRAKVSPATVSRVLNDAEYVSAATCAKVERAIREMGYVPNVIAQRLRSQKSQTLGLIISDITNSFWTTVVRAIEDVAQQHGFSILLYNTDENPDKQQRYLKIACAQQVDGVIIAPFDADASRLARLWEQDVPTTPFPPTRWGGQATELLLGRLRGDVTDGRRHVLLPTRLIVRRSCGSRLAESGLPALCLPVPDGTGIQTGVLVDPLSLQEQQDCIAQAVQWLVPV